MTSFTVRRTSLIPYTLDAGRPLRTAHGPVRFRRGYLVRLDSDAGPRGWGDAACFPGFGSSDQAVGARLPIALAQLEGQSFGATEAVDTWLADAEWEPEVRAAIELALLDLLGCQAGRSIAQLLSDSASETAATHTLVTSIDADLTRTGASVFKLKLGPSIDEDVARLRELRRLVGETARLRLDAGGGYSFSDAQRAINAFAPFGVEFIEQPVAAGQLEQMARLQALAVSKGTQIAADEDVTDAGSLTRVVEARAAGVVILKPMFVGGLLVARRLGLQAAALGLQAVVTHALESAIGRTGTMHLAATLPGTHGLAWSPERDVAAAPTARRGLVTLPNASGLGLAPRPVGGAEWLFPGRARATAVVPHPLAASALCRPTQLALIDATQRVTYQELVVRVAKVAGALQKCGVRAGERVTIDGLPGVDWAVLFHAIGWLSAVACPLPHRATETEQRAALRAFDAPHNATAGALLGTDEEAMPEPVWSLDAVRVVVATSGSSGSPKAIELTAEQLAWSAFGSALRIGHHADDTWLCALPLHHIGGLSVLWRCALGATTVLIHERFQAQLAASALDSGLVTLASLTPTMLERVLAVRSARAFHPRVRAILLGGGATSKVLFDRCRELGVPVALTWGMTEAASQIATREPGDFAPLEQGLPPLPFHRVRVTDGRLLVEGPTVNGELATSDLGHTVDGWVTVTGRSDDAIVHRGENIDPLEVERTLLTHPALADVAVFGSPSSSNGSDVQALLVARHQPIDDAVLTAHCLQFIASYKIPTRFVWCTALPRTPLGKLARGSLGQAFEEEQRRRASMKRSGGRSG